MVDYYQKYMKYESMFMAATNAAISGDLKAAKRLPILAFFMQQYFIRCQELS